MEKGVALPLNMIESQLHDGALCKVKLKLIHCLQKRIREKVKICTQAVT